MISYHSQKQLSLAGFETPFQTDLDPGNRWIKMSHAIPWDDLAAGYHAGMDRRFGRPAKDARLVIGAVIIKHKLCLSDEETVRQIQENPYLQFFCGLPGFTTQPPFAPSLFVAVRKRMTREVFESFHQVILQALEATHAKRKAGKTAPASPPLDQKASRPKEGQDDDPPGGDVPDATTPAVEASATDDATDAANAGDYRPQGKLILDATVAEQAIRYPTDLSLLNEARELSEQLINLLYPKTDWKSKPRTYRENARNAFLAVVKRRRPGRKMIRHAIKQPLQYLRRNIGYIERLMDHWPMGTPIPLPRWLMRRYWVIPHLVDQQWQMYHTNTRRCDDRIVSISQPHVRPIVRGKQSKPVEFGAKLSTSLDEHGLAQVDHLRWDAFHEGWDLPTQVEAYRRRHGHYPEVVLADSLYGTKDNRRYLTTRGIRFAGKPLGRPPKITEDNQEAIKELQAKRHNEYGQRIPIEGKFGQGKNGYRLNYIRAKLPATSCAWINSIFLVMNLLTLLRIFFAPLIAWLQSARLRFFPSIRAIAKQMRTPCQVGGALWLGNRTECVSTF